MKLRLLLGSALLLSTSSATMAQTVLDHQFRSAAEFEAYTVVDQNHDGLTWGYDDLFYDASCPRDYDADDWLITPALTLEGGKTYRLTYTAHVESEGAEQLVVTMGQSATVAGQTQVLQPAVGIASQSSESHTLVFDIASTGRYHLGFHHATTDDPFSNRLYLSSVKIEQTANQGVPAGVTDFSVQPAAEGALQAVVSLRTPTLNADGTALAELTRVDLYRGELLIHTFESPRIGQAVSFTDVLPASGSYTYRAVASNSLGEGEAVSASAFVGVDVPGPVDNLRLVYDYEAKQSHIEWEAPAVGVNGGYIDRQHLTYSVRRLRAVGPVVSGLDATSFVDDVDVDFLKAAEDSLRQVYADRGMSYSGRLVIGGEGLMKYFVQATSPEGVGAEASTDYIIIGTPRQLPYAESFAGGELSNYWRTDIHTGLGRWAVMADSRYTQDDDGGLLGFGSVDGTEVATAHTGNIDMRGVASPVLSFYYYYGEPLAKPLVVKVSRDGGQFEPIATVDLTSESAKGQYQRVSMPLTGCAEAERLQIAFELTASTTIDLLYLDHVTVIDQHEHDLAIESVVLPRNLKVGDNRYVTVGVRNVGVASVPTASYSVEVYAGGMKVGSAMGMALASQQAQSVVVPVAATIDLTRRSEVYAEVVYGADEVTANNRSSVELIDVALPTYPVATALKAVASDQGVSLSWVQPAQPRQTDEAVTESFEAYADWQRTNFGDWTLVDLDRRLTYGMSGWYFPQNSDIQSYMVFNPSQLLNTATGTTGMNAETWQPRTGEKMLASFAAYDNESNDWLISPELSGSQQLVSFYAHHPKGSEVAERFQFYISTTGIETTQFMALDQSPQTTLDEWTRYEYLVPQGTKYFAIRHVTDDGWVLLLDDVTFVPDTLAAQTSLMLYGYNVYRNGERVNTALVAQPTFVDAAGQPGDVYRVTAVYNLGESVYSQEAVAGGLDGITIVSAPESIPQRTFDVGGRPVVVGHGVIIDGSRKILR